MMRTGRKAPNEVFRQARRLRDRHTTHSAASLQRYEEGASPARGRGVYLIYGATNAQAAA